MLKTPGGVPLCGVTEDAMEVVGVRVGVGRVVGTVADVNSGRLNVEGMNDDVDIVGDGRIGVEASDARTC